MNLKSLLPKCNCNSTTSKLEKEEINQRNTVELACLLSDEILAEREKQLCKEIFSKVQRRDEHKKGYSFYFSYDPEFLHQLLDHIIFENECCPFMRFELMTEANKDIVLRITGDSDLAKKTIKMSLFEMEKNH